jgi:hypothetical protein
VSGSLDDQPDPDRRREVEDGVTAMDELADHGWREHRFDGQVKTTVLNQMSDVFCGARGEVIQGIDLPFLLEQQLGKMGPDEPRTTGYEGCSHAPEPTSFSFFTFWV